MATERKQLQEAGDIEGLNALPLVTVFEKSSSPGCIGYCTSIVLSAIHTKPYYCKLCVLLLFLVVCSVVCVIPTL